MTPRNPSLGWIEMLAREEYEYAASLCRPFYQCTPEQQVQRWEQCLRVLLELTPHERRRHFDMSVWGRKTPCGTVACAAGHCALDPWFNDRGFSILFSERTPMQPTWPGMRPDVFFGHRGYEQIFIRTWYTFDQVVSAVRKHIRKLKESK